MNLDIREAEGKLLQPFIPEVLLVENQLSGGKLQFYLLFVSR
ncbi:hypothetical protein EZS27_041703 [termite gut metagenome]|uniref:Uncharacterized protein n=1 Tax=termite gut metagenome TaxID=433724 RepID=A0A5J4PDD1_9ZZZZ